MKGGIKASGACANKLIYGRMTDIGQGTAYYDCLVEIEKYKNSRLLPTIFML